MTEQKPKMTPEKKVALKKFADIALRSLSPNMLNGCARTFDDDLRLYNYHSERKDLAMRDKAEIMLAGSAEIYIHAVDSYLQYVPNPTDYVARRETAEAILKKINSAHPSAMWDVQPGA